MNSDLHLEIYTPSKTIFKGVVGLINAPGADGEFSLLRNHVAIIAALKKGIIKVIEKAGTEHEYECNGGLLECKDNQVTILSGIIVEKQIEK